MLPSHYLFIPFLLFLHVHKELLTVLTPQDLVLLILREVRKRSEFILRFQVPAHSTRRHSTLLLFFSFWNHSMLYPIQKTHLSFRPSLGQPLLTMLLTRNEVDNYVACTLLAQFVGHDFFSSNVE